VFRGIAPTRLRAATARQAERGGYSLREMAQQHGPFEYFNCLVGAGEPYHEVIRVPPGTKEMFPYSRPCLRSIFLSSSRNMIMTVLSPAAGTQFFL